MAKRQQTIWYRRPAAILAIAALVLVVVGFGWWWATQHKASAVVVNPSTSPGVTTTPSPTIAPGNKGNSGDVAKEQFNPTPTPAATVVPSTSVTVSIVRAGQLANGGALEIRAGVEGATSGTCQANLVGPNGEHVAQSGSIAFQGGGNYSCSGLDIPASSFATNGSWKLSLTATSGDQTSAAVQQTVIINKGA